MAAAVKIFEGLKILLKHEPKAEIQAGHDVLRVGGPAPEKLDEGDRQELNNLGWSYDVREESWMRFT